MFVILHILDTERHVFSVKQQALVGLGRLVVEVPISQVIRHTHTHTHTHINTR